MILDGMFSIALSEHLALSARDSGTKALSSCLASRTVPNFKWVCEDGDSARQLDVEGPVWSRVATNRREGETRSSAGMLADESVRCRMAAICEGAAACQPGVLLPINQFHATLKSSCTINRYTQH
jgi:hypothetical protein